MAIAYCHVQMMSRAKGRSVVAAASYRSGEKLSNEREGNTYEYARKTDRVYSEILAPEHAPQWATNRAQLWNEVERIEKRKDSQLAREVMIALPKELSQEQNIVLAKAYAQTFAHEGMVADVTVHDKGDGNPHAHIMLTTRPFEQDGTWGAKSKEEYLLDAQGEKIKRSHGNYTSRKVDTTDWNRPEKLMEWRERYEHITNDHLERAGSQERIDARSYERQGIDKTPTVHMGHYAHELEQQGIETKVGNINREIQAENQQRAALKHQLDETLAAIQEEQKRQETLKQLEEFKKQETAMLAAAKQDTRKREEARRKHTISEEAREWEHLTQQEQQLASRHVTYEDLYKKVETWKQEAQKELAREAERKEAREQEYQTKATLSPYERKYLRPHRLQRPARVGSRHRMKRPNWDKFAEGLRAKQAKFWEAPHAVDWQQLAEQRVDWKQLAQEREAGRVDWQQLREHENRRYEDLYKKPLQEKEHEHEHDR